MAKEPVNPAPAVELLLSTYNGAQHLEAFLDSLFSQEYPSWTLLVRDDGSSDETLTILERYRQAHPEKVSILEDRENLGSQASFSTLAERSTAPFVMFCDQDDVWHPRKVARSMSEILALEAMYGSDQPLLAFCDLQVTDEQLKPLQASFMAFTGRKPRRVGLGTLLCRNPAPGCSMVVNRSLLDKGLPISQNAVMHDYWLILVAAAFGSIAYIPEALIKYRQHGSNQLGAVPLEPGGIAGLVKARFLKEWHPSGTDRLKPHLPQAHDFSKRYRTELRQEDREALEAYLALPDMRGRHRIRAVLKHQMSPYGLRGTLEWLLQM